MSTEDAEYLMRTFPDYFDRMMRDAGFAPAVDTSPLESGTRDLLPAIRAGDLDDSLAALLQAERSGAARSTVLRALEARIHVLTTDTPDEA